jgi:hypothetical protein
MTCKPTQKAEAGSLHILECRGKQQTLVWAKGPRGKFGWGHVGGNCITTPNLMSQYGWRYISPAQEQAA